MEIKNTHDAHAWLAAWNFAPRRGIARETVRGLRMSAAISRTYRCPDMAADYDAAADVIARYF